MSAVKKTSSKGASIAPKSQPEKASKKSKVVAPVEEEDDDIDFSDLSDLSEDDDTNSDGSDFGLTAEQEAEFAAMADRIGKSVASAKSSKAAAAGAMMSDSEAATSHRGGASVSSRKGAHVKPTPETAGVVLVSRIPYGFFEDQMRGFFSQFGTVTRLRLARNRKTGNSKHYAFVEFEAKEVAAIVAETMNNYMMFGRTIQCHFLLPSQVHPLTFKNANRTFKVIPHARIHRDAVNAPKTEEQVEALRKRQLEKEAAKRAKLAELGFDYDFPGYENRADPAAVTKKSKKAAAPASPAKAAKAAPASPAKSKKAPAPAPVSSDDDDDEDEPAPAPAAKRRAAPASPVSKKAAAAAAASPAKSKKAAAPAAAEGTPRRSTRQK